MAHPTKRLNGSPGLDAIRRLEMTPGVWFGANCISLVISGKD